MLIFYHGHSEFLLCSDRKSGFRLLTDPYDPSVGYRMFDVRCDACTVSHGHHDHRYPDKISGPYTLIDAAGDYDLGEGVRVRAIPSFHDEVRGAKRGNNFIMRITMDGLNILHLGDLGHIPDREIVEAAGRTDILMVPVGGFFTIDAQAARRTAELFAPRMVIPMHYKTGVNADWPIAGPDAFLDAMDVPAAERTAMKLVRVTAEDLSEQRRVCVLMPGQDPSVLQAGGPGKEK